MTTLMAACKGGHLDIVEYLIADKRVDVNATDNVSSVFQYFYTMILKMSYLRLILSITIKIISRVDLQPYFMHVNVVLWMLYNTS